MTAPAHEVVALCRKLLRLQKRAATAGEAQAAAHALARLLDKHRLTLAQLEAAGERQPGACTADTDRPLYTWRRVEPWRYRLGAVLCEHYGVATWERRWRKWPGGSPRDSGMYLCGTVEDVALVRELFAWLVPEALRLAAPECRGRGRVYRNSWLEGFVAGLHHQLKLARAAAEEQARAEGQRTAALVLWGEHARRAEEALAAAALGPLNTYTARSQARLRRDAYLGGVEAGAVIHLGGRLAEHGAHADNKPLLPG